MLGKWQRSLLSRKPGDCPAEFKGPCQSRSNYGPCGELLKNFICLWLTCLFPGVMLSVCVWEREIFFFIMSLKWLYILARISLLIFLIWQNKQSETYVGLSGAFWHFNRPWNPKTWKVLCSWVRTQTNNTQTKISTALSWIFCFRVAQMASDCYEAPQK